MLEQFEDKIKKDIDISSNGEKVREFVDLMLNNDCEDNDCDEILSPCCSNKIDIIFGSLPLEVKCQKCNNKMLFSELIKG